MPVLPIVITRLCPICGGDGEIKRKLCKRCKGVGLIHKKMKAEKGCL